MALDSTLAAALNEQGLRVAIGLKVELQNSTIRLFDGSGSVYMNGETYKGIDSLFGTLDALEAISEQIAETASTVTFTLTVPDSVGLAELCQPENQGSLVSLYFAVIDYNTGNAIGVPELLWKGRVDTANIFFNENQQGVNIETVSAFDRLFAMEEGARLNSTWHNRIWPNETGLDRVIAGLAPPHWGAEGGGSSTSGGGGGFSGLIRRVVEAQR